MSLSKHFENIIFNTFNLKTEIMLCMQDENMNILDPDYYLN